jgi:hypothetical protein
VKVSIEGSSARSVRRSTNPTIVFLRRRRLFVSIVFCFLTLTPISSNGQELTGRDIADSTSRDELISQSLELDINTAARDELAAWCMVLNLDTQGDAEVLRGRLRTYYGISSGDISGRSEKTRVVIESAQRSEYIQIGLGDDSQESVVRLSGGVVLTVNEPDRKRTHRVEADSVTFNQDQNTISAVGHIAYTVDTAGREEYFAGDSLTFEVSDWTGVIFRGTSERQQEVDGKDITFFFKGDSIKRSGRDILVLENGTISSHDAEDPDFSLRAKKIWITGPGEWGLFNATLYVGHIPVFYLPFYWKSGSDLLFNPVIGVRNRVGYYIQSTTYLAGEKEYDDGFSIMGFGDSAGPGYELTRDGLFLVRGGTADSEGAASPNTLKYMLDVYTSLGAMTGFQGSYPNIGKKVHWIFTPPSASAGSWILRGIHILTTEAVPGLTGTTATLVFIRFLSDGEPLSSVSGAPGRFPPIGIPTHTISRISVIGRSLLIGSVSCSPRKNPEQIPPTSSPV